MENPDMFSSVLVTGATGFIGGRLVDALLSQERRLVRVLVRDRTVAEARWGSRVEVVEQDLAKPELGGDPCRGIDVVFHLAGHAHAEDEGSDRSDEMHRSITLEGTRRLLANAGVHRVDRFLFLSSVKAIGEGTALEAVSGDEPKPTTAYGRAKREAELLVLASERPVGIVLRSPLVYGPSVKGNLRQMMGAIAAGRFPPIPSVDNRRSMIDVRDIVAALLFLETEPRAGGQVFLATDGEAYSTRRIYEAMCGALGRPVPRWSIPLPVLRLGGRAGDVLSKVLRRPAPLTTARLGKLFGSAHYSNRALVDLGFRPAHHLESSLPEMVEAWQASEREGR